MATVETERLTPAEEVALAPFFTSVTEPVFALTHLPEVVKGALFARYSRSPKSLRRLFADEFLADVPAGAVGGSVGEQRAAALYEKVFVEYGDDSVAQLGGVHLAVEGASNILTKVLEWGRLMAYLEQSTRYIPYTDRPNGRWRYATPPELEGDAGLKAHFERTMDQAFETYAALLERMQVHFRSRFARDPQTSESAWGRTIRAKALDTVRGLLPAATKSNVGLYGTGQAYEALLLRMRASGLAEVRDCADAMLVELRKVIPAFLRRVDQAERGVAWSRYLAQTQAATRVAAATTLGTRTAKSVAEVELTEFDPDGEAKVVAAAMYAASELPDGQLLEIAKTLSPAERAGILEAYVGPRTNRRHKPGRAFERTSYRFDICSDYGAFRDLQRHRLLTLEWQPLSTRLGFTTPPEIVEAGEEAAWNGAMNEAAALHDALLAGGLPQIAPYAVPMAYRVRYYMQMNAREAMHMLELRTAPHGHPSYRRVCQEMHRLIAEKAGHAAIAGSMKFVDHSSVELERLKSENAAEQRAEARKQA